MGIIIIFIPGLFSLIGWLFGQYISIKEYGFFVVFGMLLNVFLSIWLFCKVGLKGQVCIVYLAKWINVGSFVVSWEFLFDSVTVIMLLVVNIVSCLVHIYSLKYMEGDPHIIKFMSYLSIFTFFMLMLVTANNFLQLFIGWEGVGLASYLLISFWNTRFEANTAAIKAVLVNRVGDLALMMSFVLIFYYFKSLDYGVVFCLAPEFQNVYLTLFGVDFHVLSLITLLLFFGAVGKSAQLGLHIWLPDAMEGPTPVSALIHAATMVTAGVFLIIRCSPLFEYTPEILSFVCVVGGLTAVGAGICGCVQNDLKKVIAFSTCSQLGYMVFICGLSGYSIALFHLMNHAFFKALLFLSAGSVIHAVNDEQDMRKMGSLGNFLPFTYLMMVVGSLALMGFPFLTGFYSKDIILEVAFGRIFISSMFVYWLGVSAAFFTAAYSFRLIYLTFLVKANGSWKVYEQAKESDYFVLFPLSVLYFGSVFVGFIFRDMLIGPGTDFWGNSIFVLPEHSLLYEGEFLNWYLKLIPFFVSFSGVLVSFLVLKFYNWHVINYNFKFYLFIRDFLNVFVLYDKFICWFFISLVYYKVIYKFIFASSELFFLNFVSLVLSYFYKFLSYCRKYLSGDISWYFLGFFLLILTILFFTLWWGLDVYGS